MIATTGLDRGSSEQSKLVRDTVVRSKSRKKTQGALRKPKDPKGPQENSSLQKNPKEPPSLPEETIGTPILTKEPGASPRNP